MVKKIAAFLFAAFIVAGCQQGGPGIAGMGQKQTGGTLVGAGLGALAGSQIGGGTGQLAAVALGTLAGAYFGNEVGKSLDNADRAAAAQAYNQASTAPIGQRISWSNPESGHSGTVTPLREGYTQGGEQCREYRHTVIIDGRAEEQRNTFCRQPDGSYRQVS